LVVEARNDGVHLLSTDASHFGKSKKRNTSTRTRQTSSARAEIGTSVNDSVAATGTGRPLVSYITKTGDNYALLMSQTVVEGVGLAEGARVEIEQLDDGQIMIRRSKRHFTLDELLAGMTPDREHPLEEDAPRGEEKL
ncbi:MAG TPA: hypothetical protein VHX19_00610, partial [Stellaceae bacterium]|nr:hypothetical protein [Stellaceae bacterium]